jgi:hypothetical protein
MPCEGWGHGKVWGDVGKAARRWGAGGFAVSGQLGNFGAKKTPTGTEQPFDTIVDGYTPVEPPSPSPSITRRGTPAALAVGVHSFWVKAEEVRTLGRGQFLNQAPCQHISSRSVKLCFLLLFLSRKF